MELLSSVKYNIKDPELYCVVLWLWNCVADIYAGFIENFYRKLKLIIWNILLIITEASCM